jgi:hypothetical protein
VLRWLDNFPLVPLTIAALLLGLSPVVSEPHLLQKLRLLFAGRLNEPLDIFDLAMHASLPLLLVLKLLRLRQLERHRRK